MPRPSARMFFSGLLIFLGCEDGENSSESSLPQFTIIEDTVEPDSSEPPQITVEWLERSRPGRPVPAQVVFASHIAWGCSLGWASNVGKDLHIYIYIH